MNTQLTRIDDEIAYQAGAVIIKLKWVNHSAYNVTVYRGTDRINDNCGSYPTEDEARLIARGYAELYKAEAGEDEIVHLRREPLPIACGATGRVRVTRTFSEVTCQPCIDAEDRRQGRKPKNLNAFRQSCTRRPARLSEPLRRVLATADNGYILRGKKATSRQLIALDAMGVVELDKRKTGNRWEIKGAWLASAKREERAA